MEDNNIEMLRQQYFKAILYLQNEEEIKEALPIPEYTNFFPILKGLIELIDNEIKTNELMLKDNEKGSEMYEYIKDDIKLLKFKRGLCIQLLLKAQNKIEIEESSKKTPVKNLIFATTTHGNIYLEKDIKNMDEEFYERIEKSLSSLEAGDTIDIKPISNNQKLTKIWEIKQFQTRIFFKNLSHDTIYIISARIKKDNNSSIDREEAIIRAKKTNKEYNKLIEEIKDPIKKEELIAKNKKIKDYLFSYITTHKRG